MSAEPIVRPRPTPGSIIGAAVRLLRERLGAVALLVAVLTLLPSAWYYVVSYQLAAQVRATTAKPTEMLTHPDVWVSLAALTVSAQFAQAAIAHLLFERARGRDATVRDALVAALGRFGPLLGVGLVYAIAIFAGMMLCCVPGVMAWLAYAVAGPVCLIERLGVTASLRRSAELTKGLRWTLFGTFMVPYLGVFAVSGAGQLLLRTHLVAHYSMNAVMGYVTGIVFGSLTAVAYEHIRTFKEGGQVEQAAAVFE